MEQYIQIAKINDFLYSPASVYLHSIYEDFTGKVYKEKAQIEGLINHKNIDSGDYSTSKNIISGISVYSKKLGVMGKIDIYDKKKQHLIERKTCIKKIHDGHKLQLYAQYYAMEEMGMYIKKIYIHSLNDNKRYELENPNSGWGFWRRYLKRTIKKMRKYKIEKVLEDGCDYHSKISIYNPLSW